MAAFGLDLSVAYSMVRKLYELSFELITRGALPTPESNILNLSRMDIIKEWFAAPSLDYDHSHRGRLHQATTRFLREAQAGFQGAMREDIRTAALQVARLDLPMPMLVDIRVGCSRELSASHAPVLAGTLSEALSQQARDQMPVTPPQGTSRSKRLEKAAARAANPKASKKARKRARKLLASANQPPTAPTASSPNSGSLNETSSGGSVGDLVQGLVQSELEEAYRALGREFPRNLRGLAGPRAGPAPASLSSVQRSIPQAAAAAPSEAGPAATSTPQGQTPVVARPPVQAPPFLPRPLVVKSGVRKSASAPPSAAAAAPDAVPEPPRPSPAPPSAHAPLPSPPAPSRQPLLALPVLTANQPAAPAESKLSYAQALQGTPPSRPVAPPQARAPLPKLVLPNPTHAPTPLMDLVVPVPSRYATGPSPPSPTFPMVVPPLLPGLAESPPTGSDHATQAPLAGPSVKPAAAPSPREAPQSRPIPLDSPTFDNTRSCFGSSNSLKRTLEPLVAAKPGRPPKKSRTHRTTTNLQKLPSLPSKCSPVPGTSTSHQDAGPPPITFSGEWDTTGPTNPLSNLYVHPLVVEGVTFASAEHAWQAIKAQRCGRPDIARRIMAAGSPKGAKDLGGLVNSLMSDYQRTEGMLDVMRGILEAKYHSCPAFRQALYDSRAYPLTHTAPHFYWAAFFHRKGQRLTAPNMHARLLTELRVRELAARPPSPGPAHTLTSPSSAPLSPASPTGSAGCSLVAAQQPRVDEAPCPGAAAPVPSQLPGWSEASTGDEASSAHTPFVTPGARGLPTSSQEAREQAQVSFDTALALVTTPSATPLAAGLATLSVEGGQPAGSPARAAPPPDSPTPGAASDDSVIAPTPDTFDSERPSQPLLTSTQLTRVSRSLADTLQPSPRPEPVVLRSSSSDSLSVRIDEARGAFSRALESRILGPRRDSDSSGASSPLLFSPPPRGPTPSDRCTPMPVLSPWSLSSDSEPEAAQVDAGQAACRPPDVASPVIPRLPQPPSVATLRAITRRVMEERGDPQPAAQPGPSAFRPLTQLDGPRVPLSSSSSSEDEDSLTLVADSPQPRSPSPPPASSRPCASTKRSRGQPTRIPRRRPVPQAPTRSDPAGPRGPPPAPSGPAQPEGRVEEPMEVSPAPTPPPQPPVARAAAQPARPPAQRPPGPAAGGPPTAPVAGPFLRSHQGQPKTRWRLELTNHETLIIGDSNLRSFRSLRCAHHSVAVQSYSGARAIHLCQMFNERRNVVGPQRHLKHLVVAAGLNNRSQDIATAREQMDKAISAGKRLFPFATVHVAAVDVSPKLLAPCKRTLNALNAHIRAKCRAEPARLRYIEPLPTNDLHTDGKGVHWRADTPALQLDRLTHFLGVNVQESGAQLRYPFST